MQRSNTTADLRGIHNVGNGVAWASGTHGTVLRTEDGGYVWQTCTIPPGAEKLDFRGIQAFDANTAIVMSSGPGDQSRLYKTTDGCATWKLVFTNPDKDGFFDSIQAANEIGQNVENREEDILILGDSVQQKVQLWEWHEGEDPEAELYYGTDHTSTEKGESSFAASNSILQVVSSSQIDPKWKYSLRWASGTAAHVYMSFIRDEHTACEPCLEERKKISVPMEQGSASAGIFSFSFRNDLVGVAVGGDFQKPASNVKTSAFTLDGGQTWSSTKTPPHGYRSAVAYDSNSKTWITVGPNGTDISTDDGRNWRALKPTSTDAPDADKNWNALSLPYVVGPKGRIGKLTPAALKP
jgi:photosystem II stability/assembly factor-like uncharacterized protein